MSTPNPGQPLPPSPDEVPLDDPHEPTDPLGPTIPPP
jgi:hypothetical protein